MVARKERSMAGKFVFTEYPLKGFAMEFDNGYSISVQWHTGSYCANRHKQFPSDNSTTAEMMVTNSQGVDQEPIGWATPDAVAAKMAEIASINTKGSRFDFW
jgi:hypothetical protein|tara:strand:+ start:220 stop:525 length:306 start_codon:yes stop_codon:yes gene_type:complete